MNRAQARRQRWLERFNPRTDDGLVCHEMARGGMGLVDPQKVRDAHARRMAIVDDMKPEYRALLNRFARLPAGLTEDFSNWSRCNVPIDSVLRTLRDRYGEAAVDQPPLRPIRNRRPPGEPRRRRTAAEIAAAVGAIPVPSSGQDAWLGVDVAEGPAQTVVALIAPVPAPAMGGLADVLQWAQGKLRDMVGIKADTMAGIRSALAEGDSRRLAGIRKELGE